MNQPSSEIREEIKDLIVASSNKGADNVARLISLGMDYHLAEADPERTNIFGLLDRLEAAIKSETLASLKQCSECDYLKLSCPTPEGDETCPTHGVDLMDAEVINTDE